MDSIKVLRNTALFSISLFISSLACSMPDVPNKETLYNDLEIVLSDDEILHFRFVKPLNIWFGKYEVTLGQLIHMLPSAKKRPQNYSARYVEGDYNLNQFPAVMISWNDAEKVCKFLNKKYASKLPDGYMFRLPTESEWEAMARCGRDRIYPWGDSWPPSAMNDGVLPNMQGEEKIKINGKIPPAVRAIRGYQDGWPSMAPVEKSGANEWGIYGVAGNVREWVEGWYDKDDKLRLLKGSSAFSNQPFEAKISSRDSVKGQSPWSGLFFWGTVRNQGDTGTGLRIVVGRGPACYRSN